MSRSRKRPFWRKRDFKRGTSQDSRFANQTRLAPRDERRTPLNGQPNSEGGLRETRFQEFRDFRMCESKMRYRDKRDALTAVNSFRRNRGRHGRPNALRAYACPICKGWHLTKKV